MKDQPRLQAKRVNFGQSLIWLEAEDRDLTPPRSITTNEVDNAAHHHCAKEVFDEFYAQYHTGLGSIASLATPNLDAIASDLRLNL